MKSTCMHYYSYNINYLFVYYVFPMVHGGLKIRGVVEESMVGISFSGAHTCTMKGDEVTKYNQFPSSTALCFEVKVCLSVNSGCNNTPMRYSLIHTPREQLIRQKPFVACFACHLYRGPK